MQAPTAYSHIRDPIVLSLNAGGTREANSLSAVYASDLVSGSPVRTFRMYKGQRHYSGEYWSATMRGFVTYESRLELARLMLADFDRSVISILSQPFTLRAEVDNRTSSHVPDFLTVTRHHKAVVIDVKRIESLRKPKVARTLDWTRDVVLSRGWDYEVWSTAPDVVLANVRFLAGYRIPRRSYAMDVEAAREVVLPGMTVAEAVDATVACGLHRALAKPAVMHLLWLGERSIDLHEPLDDDSLIGPAR